MINRVAINMRPDDHGSLPLIEEIISFFRERNVEVLLPDYDMIREDDRFATLVVSQEVFLKQPNMVVVIGGDGTFLRTARSFSDTGQPLFGINRGRLGFLTEFLPDEALSYLARVLQGDYYVSERTLLEAVHLRRNSEINRMIFLNDAVISKGAFSRPIVLHLEIDNEFLNCYSGDGIIIATATGSTAYSLSAGGPILIPSLDSAYIINPVCPHMLAIRPMILPITAVLKARIVSDFGNLLLTIDGQEAIRIEGNDEILFRESGRRIKLITHPRHNYYEILRQKLGWGKNLSE